MAKKKKYYAVAKGVVPGIYNTWPEAKRQIDGFPGAVYKGFFTLEEAEAWMKKPSYRSAPRKKTAAPRMSASESNAPKEGEVTIYTDGGSINNPGPGGYGVVEICGDKRREFSGGFRLTTNNRMELMACIVALRELECRDKPITLYSDSSYVVNGISRGWAKNWRRNNWIKSDKKPAINPDLWAELLDLTEGLDITFRWVKGHAGHPENERCDELANGTAKKPGLPEDKGYGTRQ